MTREHRYLLTVGIVGAALFLLAPWALACVAVALGVEAGQP